MHAHDAPARLPVKKWPWLATSPVALQNTPKKATRSTSTRHSRIISCEILEEKISILSSHRPMRRILTNKCCGKQHFHDKKRRILLWRPFLIKHMIQILRFRPVITLASSTTSYPNLSFLSKKRSCFGWKWRVRNKSWLRIQGYWRFQTEYFYSKNSQVVIQ